MVLAEYNMTLLDLPNEILQRVAGFVHPPDLVAFVTTCRQCYTITETRLKQHRDLRDKYSKISVVSDYDDGSHINHPVDVIHRIQTNPWLAFYIKKVCFDQHDLEVNRSHEDWVEGRYLDSNTEVLWNQLDPKLVQIVSCMQFEQQDQHCLAEEMWKGGHGETFAALLTLLPSLTTLVLGTSIIENENYDFLHMFFDHASSRPSTCQCLTKLHTIELGEYDDLESSELQFLDTMTLIPSLRNIHFESFADNFNWVDSARNRMNLPSNVENMSMGECGMALTGLIQLIKFMHKLKRLDFEGFFYVSRNDGARKESLYARARFRADVLRIGDTKGLKWKMTVKPKNDNASVSCTVRMRVAELAHEL